MEILCNRPTFNASAQKWIHKNFRPKGNGATFELEMNMQEVFEKKIINQHMNPKVMVKEMKIHMHQLENEAKLHNRIAMKNFMEIVKNPNGPTIFKEIEENHENHINLTMKINMNHEGFMEKHIDLSIMKQRSWPNQLNFMMNDREMGNFMNTAMNKLFENEKVMCNDNKPKPNTLNFMLHYEINQLFYRFPNYTQMVQHH